MAGSSTNRGRAEVLVVHCVDTEGPIGGDVRRRPDGSAEFMANWRDIGKSIRRLTNPEFRRAQADSFGRPYIYNWFIMDFTGFRTNPKQRIAKYNDTYDHFKHLPTQPDGFYWHYHHPPADGAGDGWSDDWDSSQEYLNILLHRLVEREDWPEAYRAGGTIEDNKASQWLEDNVMVDYSNRVSDQSYPTKNIFDFNWQGAPAAWGYYHPHHKNFLKTGKMRRFIVRSVDLWSRINVLTPADVRQAFTDAQKNKRPVILSYFSHDHREMFDETVYVVAMVKQVAKETGIRWRSSRALEALQICAQLKPVKVKVNWTTQGNKLRLKFSQPTYQKSPFIGMRASDGSLSWLAAQWQGRLRAVVELPAGVKKVVVGGTSLSGDKFIQSIKL